jgi:hypothetical protein
VVLTSSEPLDGTHPVVQPKVRLTAILSGQLRSTRETPRPVSLRTLTFARTAHDLRCFVVLGGVCIFHDLVYILQR